MSVGSSTYMLTSWTVLPLETDALFVQLSAAPLLLPLASQPFQTEEPTDADSISHSQLALQR
jgi:hypothetical protein